MIDVRVSANDLSNSDDLARLQTTSDHIFMIVGMGRSGTSLLQAMLSSHPAVIIPNETQFYTVIARRQHRFASLQRPEVYRKAVDYVLRTRQVRQMALEADTVHRLAEAGNPSWDTIFLALLTAYGMKHGAKRVGEKSPGHLLYVGHLKDIFPAARFIQIVRDPRGTINSLRKAPFGSRSIMMGIQSWRRSYALQQKWHAELGPTRSYCVTYESLVREPRAVLESICRFLDMTFDPQMLAHDQRKVTGFGAWQQGHMQNTLKPVFTSSIEKWRQDLRPVQIAMIEEELKSEMEGLGYETSRPETRCLALHKACSTMLGRGHRLLNQPRRLFRSATTD